MLGCIRKSAVWRVTPSHVIVRDWQGEKRYLRAPIPPEISDAFREMLQFTRLDCAPHLEFVESAYGAGGLYYDGLILIGVDDAHQIAGSLWTSSSGRICRQVKNLWQVRGIPTDDPYTFLWMAVLARILSHELGHAVTRLRGVQTPFRDDEAAADFIAGKLDAFRGRDPGIGALIFHSIGCEGPWCTHPSPCGRAHAYVNGFEQGSRQIAATG